MAATILVVDDDADILRLIETVLARAGYTVRLAGDGLAALDDVQVVRPDLVLADIVMPRLDGASLAVRLWMRYPGLPVVLMSAFERPPGSVDVPFVAKPFVRTDLLDVVAAALARSGRFPISTG